MVQEAPYTICLAGDEAGLYLQATTYHVWSPTGQTPIIRADPGQAKINFYGSLKLPTGQEIIMRSDRVNAEMPAQHLEMLLDAYLDVHPRLEIIFFPTTRLSRRDVQVPVLVIQYTEGVNLFF